MTREEAEKELCRLLEEAEADIQAGRTVPAEEVFAQLREEFAPRNIVYLTGDTHGRFERIVDFCSRREMVSWRPAGRPRQRAAGKAPLHVLLHPRQP